MSIVRLLETGIVTTSASSTPIEEDPVAGFGWSDRIQPMITELVSPALTVCE